ncbi:MAG TPA: hypothetical protein DCE81_08885, partial [Cytophagales bacterium]|nr:hypothetical protein [Cytophagales bacterium]
VFGGKSFTRRAWDWQLYLVIEGHDIEFCRRLAHHLKKLKSRKYLCRLKDCPEKVQAKRNPCSPG